MEKGRLEREKSTKGKGVRKLVMGPFAVKNMSEIIWGEL